MNVIKQYNELCAKNNVGDNLDNFLKLYEDDDLLILRPKSQEDVNICCLPCIATKTDPTPYCRIKYRCISCLNQHLFKLIHSNYLIFSKKICYHCCGIQNPQLSNFLSVMYKNSKLSNALNPYIYIGYMINFYKTWKQNPQYKSLLDFIKDESRHYSYVQLFNIEKTIKFCIKQKNNIGVYERMRFLSYFINPYLNNEVNNNLKKTIISLNNYLQFIRNSPSKIISLNDYFNKINQNNISSANFENIITDFENSHIDTTIDDITENINEKSIESINEKPTENTTEKPTENTNEKPTENTTEKPTEKSSEKPTENTTEKPTENTTENIEIKNSVLGKRKEDLNDSPNKKIKTVSMKTIIDDLNIEINNINEKKEIYSQLVLLFNKYSDLIEEENILKIQDLISELMSIHDMNQIKDKTNIIGSMILVSANKK